jgi:hypothetical protein
MTCSSSCLLLGDAYVPIELSSIGSQLPRRFLNQGDANPMKFYAKLVFGAAAYLFLSAGIAGTASQPPAEGGKLPEIILTVPLDTELRQYLGVGGKETFTIPEIKAEVVLIEIFSMY